jgi:hypothetical protein
MKNVATSFKLIATSVLLLLLFGVAGCGSTGSSGNSSSGTNYGTGMNDPWPSSAPTTTVSPTTGAGGR